MEDTLQSETGPDHESRPFYETEPIPDEDDVFLRVFMTHFKQNVPSDSAFIIRGGNGMSVDWSKYGSPKTTQRDPAKYRVASAAVKEIRSSVDGQLLFRVVHDPVQWGMTDGPNQAHSLVIPSRETKPHPKNPNDRLMGNQELGYLKKYFREISA